MKKIVSALFLVACGGSDVQPTDPTTPAATTNSQTPPASTVVPTPTATEAPKPPVVEAPKAPVATLTWEGLKTPESVIYDAENDRYLVSNINGKPLDADANGFISELSPDGKVTKLKFAEGTAKAPLNAPKGMAIVKGVLYVSDIDTVRMFDAKTGASKGSVAVKGATFLNDITAAPDGRVFVSDTGIDAKFESNGSDAVYQIKAGKVSVYLKDKELGGPNGLAWTTFGLAVNSFSKPQVVVINDAFVNPGKSKTDQSKFLKMTKTPKGGLDGLVVSENTFWTSSWEGKAIYKGTFEGEVKPALEGLEAPADFAYDAKRNRVIVPRFMGDKVEAYDVK